MDLLCDIFHGEVAEAIGQSGLQFCPRFGFKQHHGDVLNAVSVHVLEGRTGDVDRFLFCEEGCVEQFGGVPLEDKRTADHPEDAANKDEHSRQVSPSVRIEVHEFVPLIVFLLTG